MDVQVKGGARKKGPKSSGKDRNSGCHSIGIGVGVSAAAVIVGVIINYVHLAPEKEKQPETSLIVVGLNSGEILYQDVIKISLDRTDSVTKIGATPAYVSPESAACQVDGSLYAVGLGTPLFNQLWRSNQNSKWTQLANMTSGRRRHCVAVIGHEIYVLGGWRDSDESVLDDVISYDTLTDTWTAAGKLAVGVQSAACVAYKDAIYVFGGGNDDTVEYVQRYIPAEHSCDVVSRNPHADRLLRAVVWKDSAIVLGPWYSLVYNFTAQDWLIRNQYNIGTGHFGVALHSGVIYVAGGGSHETRENKIIWTNRNDVRSVLLRDVFNHKPVQWRHHATLPVPVLVDAYAVIQN